MNTSKLSKLQKWILTRASQGPDTYTDTAERKEKTCVFMARVIHEFYGIETHWTKRAEKHGHLIWYCGQKEEQTLAEHTAKYPVYASKYDFKGVDVRKQRVSVSRAFKSLKERGLGEIIYGLSGWRAFVASETVNLSLHDKSMLTVSD